MAAIKGETLELEIRHKVNSSWHPCRVSLSYSNAESGIIVNFENSNEEDIISNREDALKRLRIRSTSLKDGECASIKEGDSVLAMYKDQFKSLFFDAVIEKPYRVKHSNRVFCRCTFEIKWLNPEMKDETMTIPSKSIMKHSKEKVDCHPIFAAFLNALGPAEEVEVPSTLSFLEENNFEADLDGLLEKHIEEISRHADISTDCSSDVLLEVNRANYCGRKQKSVVTRQTSSNDSSSNFRRSTRSQKKEQVKVEELKKGLEEDKEIKKGLEEDKHFLSPLAARAALASYVHGYELPTKRQLSFSHAEKKDNANLPQNELENNNANHSFDETWEYTKSGAPLENNMTDLTNSIQNSDNKQKGTKNKTKQKESPWEEEKTVHALEESESQKGSSLTITSNSIDSTKAGKLSRQSMLTRVTRSSVHKEIEASYEVKLKSHSKELSNSENTARVTHSRNQKEHGYPSIDLEFKKTDLIQNTHDIYEELRNKKEVSLVIVSNSVDSVRARVTSVHKEIEPSTDEVEQGSSNKKLPDIVNSTRLTRWRSQKEQSSLDVDTSLRKTSMTQDTHEKFEDVTALEGKRKNRSISSIVDSNTELHRDDSTVTSEASGVFLKDSENASGELQKTKRKKAVSIKKPELRISPRLNFLPRTRSQKKA